MLFRLYNMSEKTLLKTIKLFLAHIFSKDRYSNDATRYTQMKRTNKSSNQRCKNFEFTFYYNYIIINN